MVRPRCRVLEFMEDMTGQGSSSGHDRRAGHRCLSKSGTPKHLRRSLAAAAGHEAHSLVHPDSEVAKRSDVPHRDRHDRQEGRRGCALELSRAHLAP
jgi:hypothetical protein